MILQMPEGARRILFGLIVLFVTAAYLTIVEVGGVATIAFDLSEKRHSS
jgi:hypothetical protein